MKATLKMLFGISLSSFWDFTKHPSFKSFESSEFEVAAGGQKKTIFKEWQMKVFLNCWVKNKMTNVNEILHKIVLFYSLMYLNFLAEQLLT